jgi:hypothetical protein
MSLVGRPAGDPMERIARRPQLGREFRIRSDVGRSRGHPALRIAGSNNCELGRPIRRERFIAKDGLFELVALSGIHGR